MPRQPLTQCPALAGRSVPRTSRVGVLSKGCVLGVVPRHCFLSCVLFDGFLTLSPLR